MPPPKTTREDVLRLLDNDGFGNIVDGKLVSVSRQEQLDRALALACEIGDLELVKQLNKNGAVIHGNSEPLNVAAYYDHLRVAEFLLSHGANVDGRARMFGETPLMTAAGSASLSVFRLLLTRGADPTAVDEEGASAFTWAMNGRHTALLADSSVEPSVIADYDTIIQTLGSNA